MKVTKKQMANYLNVSYPTARKEYNYYLELAGNHKRILLVSDLQRIDLLSETDILKKLRG